MKLTIGKLKKIIKGLPDNMPIYTADHDHSEYETNGLAGYAEVMDQSESEEEIRPEFLIKGKYLVIHT